MEPLPEDILRFLEANIESVDQLEILRILAENRDKEWSSAALAREVQSQPQTIAKHLEALEKRGLLSATREQGVTYRLAFAIPELEQQAARLLQLYNQRTVTMIRLLYARANAALKNLADAFRIRKPLWTRIGRGNQRTIDRQELSIWQENGCKRSGFSEVAYRHFSHIVRRKKDFAWITKHRLPRNLLPILFAGSPSF